MFLFPKNVCSVDFKYQGVGTVVGADKSKGNNESLANGNFVECLIYMYIKKEEWSICLK